MEGENQPVGLVLCAEKSEEKYSELMQPDKSNIRIADYIIQLPDKNYTFLLTGQKGGWRIWKKIGKVIVKSGLSGEDKFGFLFYFWGR